MEDVLLPVNGQHAVLESALPIEVVSKQTCGSFDSAGAGESTTYS